jgi:hypothetical protein
MLASMNCLFCGQGVQSLGIDLYNSASPSMETNQRSKQGLYFELIHRYCIAKEARKKRKKMLFRGLKKLSYEILYAGLPYQYDNS